VSVGNSYSRASNVTGSKTTWRNMEMRISLRNGVAILGGFLLIAAMQMLAQDALPSTAQVVAVDECDPATFNPKLGHGFCHNVSLGKFTTFDDLFAEAQAGNPDKKWDFEPDLVQIKKGGVVLVTDQGGEPHTFTEVKQFGGGFVDGLNGGEQTVEE